MPSSSPDNDGLKKEISTLAGDAGRYLQARAELLAIESQEAAGVLGKRFTALAIGASLLSIGYLFLMVAATALLGNFMAEHGNNILSNWIGAALILGTLHLLPGFIFLLKARGKKQGPLFEYTRREWAKDQSWIAQNNGKKR